MAGDKIVDLTESCDVLSPINNLLTFVILRFCDVIFSGLVYRIANVSLIGLSELAIYYFHEFICLTSTPSLIFIGIVPSINMSGFIFWHYYIRFMYISCFIGYMIWFSFNNFIERFADEIQPKEDLKSLKILSYNVWFAEDIELRIRMRAIGDIIQLHNPDVICFQVLSTKFFFYGIFCKLKLFYF